MSSRGAQFCNPQRRGLSVVEALAAHPMGMESKDEGRCSGYFGACTFP